MESIQRILLVDDDTVSNFINKAILNDLELQDNQIQIVSNGLEALNLLRDRCMTHGEGCPTVILLDLKMPVMDGFEFLEELNKYDTWRDLIDIYLLTSSSNPKDIERAGRYDISGYLSKPLTREKLKQVLK